MPEHGASRTLMQMNGIPKESSILAYPSLSCCEDNATITMELCAIDIYAVPE